MNFIVSCSLCNNSSHTSDVAAPITSPVRCMKFAWHYAHIEKCLEIGCRQERQTNGYRRDLHATRVYHPTLANLILRIACQPKASQLYIFSKDLSSRFGEEATTLLRYTAALERCVLCICRWFGSLLFQSAYRMTYAIILSCSLFSNSQ